MIKLRYTENSLVLDPEGTADVNVVQQPLHSIYLKSSLKSNISKGQYYWESLQYDQIASTIENIVSHFSRYHVVIDIDDNCRGVLLEKTKSQDEFNELLEKARILKNTPSKEEREKISSLLSPGFKRKLKDFQLNSLHHLSLMGNAANFSVPGSGKTSIALAYYYLLKNTNKIDAVFVIGPASCFEPWEKEFFSCFEKFPNSIRIAGLSKIQRNESYLLAQKYDLILTTYHSAIRDVNQIIECLKQRRYLLILDESHYIKRPQGGKITETVLVLSKFSKYKVILSGTPMPNSLEDLWSQFAFLWDNKSPLGSVEHYLKEIRNNNANTSIESVKEKIDPLFYRVTKKQLKLPPVTLNTVNCELSPLQKRIYEGVAIQFVTQLKEEPPDKDAMREWRRARAIRLLQIASNPVLLRQQCDEFLLPPMDVKNLSLKHGIEHYANYEIPGKFVSLTNLVNKICANGEKLVIWTSFIHNLKMLSILLRDYYPVAIHGSVPVSSTDGDDFTREKLITIFKTDNQCKVLLANPAACAESISLHDVCHHAIYLDRTFNCAHYLQSLDRIHRIGLAPNQITNYYFLNVENTIDSIVDKRLNEKMGNMGKVLEDVLPGVLPGYWYNQLGDEEIVDLDLVEQHIKSFSTK